MVSTPFALRYDMVYRQVAVMKRVLTPVAFTLPAYQITPVCAFGIAG